MAKFGEYLIITLIASTAGGCCYADSLKDLSRGMPGDVVQVMRRRVRCDKLAKELPDMNDAGIRKSNRGQADQAKKDLKYARCTSLQEDERKVRDKYKHDINVIERLNRMRDQDPDVPTGPAE